MPKLMTRLLFASALAASALSPAVRAQARVHFDDGNVRIQDVRFKPGDQGPSIPRPLRVIRVVEGGTMERLYADGRVENVDYRAGEVSVHPAAEPFVPRNAGSTDIVLYVVALNPRGDGGWATLLDAAAGLDQWRTIGEANWRVEGGAVVADAGKGGYLVSKATYGDFELRAEFRAEPGTNSGVFFRVADPARVTSRNAYELNIYDESPNPAYGTGAIVNVAAVAVPTKVAGRWSTLEIVARGEHLIARVNGVATVDTLDGRLARGPIALQYRGGAIRWRKVEVRSFPAR